VLPYERLVISNVLGPKKTKNRGGKQELARRVKNLEKVERVSNVAVRGGVWVLVETKTKKKTRLCNFNGTLPSRKPGRDQNPNPDTNLRQVHFQWEVGRTFGFWEQSSLGRGGYERGADAWGRPIFHGFTGWKSGGRNEKKQRLYTKKPRKRVEKVRKGGGVTTRRRKGVGPNRVGEKSRALLGLRGRIVVRSTHVEGKPTRQGKRAKKLASGESAGENRGADTFSIDSRATAAGRRHLGGTGTTRMKEQTFA